MWLGGTPAATRIVVKTVVNSPRAHLRMSTSKNNYRASILRNVQRTAGDVEHRALGRTLARATTTAARLGVGRGYRFRVLRTGHIPELRPGTVHYYVPADVAPPVRTRQRGRANLADLAKSRVR